MKLTKQNFTSVIDFIDEQINDNVFGLFDKDTDLIDAVKQTIEHLEEVQEWATQYKRTTCKICKSLYARNIIKSWVQFLMMLNG